MKMSPLFEMKRKNLSMLQAWTIEIYETFEQLFVIFGNDRYNCGW